MINIRLQRRTSAVATAVLLVSGVVVIAAAPAAQAAGASIALAKSATASALPGAPISYRLTATNPGTATEYNLSLSDVLPVGVSYQAGSSLPVGAGEPVVRSIGTPPGTQQVLVWQNIADLSVGGTYQVGFQAVPDATAFPAGATVTNAASAYTNTDPRMTPTFDSSGTVTPGTYTETATSAPATTSVVPITIAKSEPSPEGELVRGVHDNTTVYTLKVTNSSQGTTSGAQVTDYLPAGLEFLGCGGVDNGSAREYPGAPSLTATPLVPSCLAPTAVTTVNNPVAVPALPAGVYTRVTWSLGDLPGGAVQTVAYRAAVPMLANTMTFTGGTPGGATAQGANLDNNNGAPTRETATAQSATNQASVSGTYQGSYLGSATPGATPVSGSTTLTRTLQDLALAKSVSPATFDQGGIATYTLTLRGSEYVTSSGVVLTDVIPDGLCPLDDKSNYSVPPIATCAPAPGFAPTISGSSTSSVSFASVAYDASSGSFTVVFTPVSVPRDGVVVITYQARMRGSYRDGDPTTAGDAYTNKVALTGTTTPVPATGVIGTVTVHDDSQSTIASTGPSVTKTTLPNTEAPYQCAATGYGDSTSLPAAQTMFHQGDRICFRLRVDFPSGTNTRNPIVTDFLPVGTAYEAGSAKLTANNTVPSADVSFNEAAASAPANPANPAWTLGNTVGANRFVAKGAVFEAQLSAIVTGTSVSRTINITDNLMKFMAQNSAGDPISLRAFQPIAVTPTPDVSVLKGVRNINASSPDNGPNVDNLQVREADVVTFRVDVSNNGTAANGTAVPVFGTDVWDVLPAGISCAQISTISDSGACNAPGALPVAAPGRSVIRWQLPAPLAVGATRTLTYDMTIPGATSVSTNFVNNVSVRSFQANTNIVDVPSRTTTTYYPASNVDTSVPVVQQRAPVATDPSNVFLPSVAVTKSQTTAISESNNNTAGQATIGELVTYTLTATVPAGSTVYGARLTDPMPTGLTFLGATAGFSATGLPPTSLPLPAGVTLNAGNGTLTWPTTYDNTSTTPQLFAVTITARVSTLAGNANGTVRNNVASFTSNTAAAGGTAVPARTASTGLTVVVPAPT
ncbi:MAG: isopeptide-forming domain-containing fimbrial protein, partial [Candidatus Nanopelagicales bacterium]